MEAKELQDLLKKVGGKYKLVTLYQKRMRELQRGLPRLTDVESGNMWEIVSKEIMTSKVDLIMGEEAEHMRKELALREAAEEENEKRLKGEGAKAEAPKAEAKAE
ncbi:MAG TPA: DNA-directed RNA polymerase subunit omega [Planctomycetota bacterium]|nr:DNA-directed RNA polymerase subunit omega [Planctomycetota bacterium]